MWIPARWCQQLWDRICEGEGQEPGERLQWQWGLSWLCKNVEWLIDDVKHQTCIHHFVWMIPPESSPRRHSRNVVTVSCCPRCSNIIRNTFRDCLNTHSWYLCLLTLFQSVSVFSEVERGRYKDSLINNHNKDQQKIKQLLKCHSFMMMKMYSFRKSSSSLNWTRMW